jgi:eukaryotic-like serine/threonine-protein kinase
VCYTDLDVNAPASSIAPGTIIGERWELLAHLGAGAMGDVWRARHLALGHEVAIKLMKPVASGNRELVQRFTREARIAAQLRHRHIARVEDFGASPDGAPWLVMELLVGESLEALFERLGKLDRETVVTVARHVGAACDVAHAAGIVHRDLKPANCFMVREEDGTAQVKVLDFGVAKAADGLKLTGVGVQLLGTPVYMSPEQTQGPSDIDGRSDLWSLAVMLFELVTGQLPFDAETLPALLLAIGHAPVPSVRSIDPKLPAALDAWAARALDRDRDRRFQTGRELADAFATALATPLVETRASAAPQLVPSPMAHAATVLGMPVVPYVPPHAHGPTAHPAATQRPYAQPSIPQPSFAQGTPPWQSAQHAPRPPSPRPQTALLVGVTVVLTLAVLSFVWVFAMRSQSAPTRIAPEPTPTPTVVSAHPPTTPTPTQPTPTQPTPTQPTPTVVVARPATAPTQRPVVRPVVRPVARPMGTFEPTVPARPVPVFGTSGVAPARSPGAY